MKRASLLLISAVLLVASLMVLWLSSKLQKVISEPIFHLEKTAARVASEKNYSIRAFKHAAVK